jgi:DnaJ-class molecular chaperone
MTLAEAYELLDVPAGTKDEAILKKAFKKKAQVHHPDRDGGNEEYFKKVKEAYELLSNPPKQQNRVYGGNPGDIHFGPDVEEIIRRHYANGHVDPFRGFNLNIPMHVNKTITLEQGFMGGDVVINIPGFNEPINLPIHAGLAPGSQFEGTVSSENGPKPIIVTIQFSKHATFELVGNDLSMTVSAPLIDFYTGGRIKVTILTGAELAIKIPENFQPGKVLRLKGKGYNMNGQYGNLLITINAELPKLTETKIEKLQEILND